MRHDYDRQEASASTKLTYLLIGGGIGAVIALLFAPKSGVELREDIADATRKGLEKGKETAHHLQEVAGEYYEVSREKASELVHTHRRKRVPWARRPEPPRLVPRTRSRQPSKRARTPMTQRSAAPNQSQ
jgi:hypothetical protein